MLWGETTEAKVPLDNEVNLSVNAISQVDLQALINLDGRTIANDKNAPSMNAAEGSNGWSVDQRWYDTFAYGVIAWGEGGWSSSGIPGTHVAARVCREVGGPNVRSGSVDFARR